jgi:hypothetical protein
MSASGWRAELLQDQGFIAAITMKSQRTRRSDRLRGHDRQQFIIGLAAGPGPAHVFSGRRTG